MSRSVIVTVNALHLLSSEMEKRDEVLLVTGQHLDPVIFQEGVAINNIKVPGGLLEKKVIETCLQSVSFIPSVIIAIGGGRIMDAAKLMIHFSGWQNFRFIAIPTTAGSGSEATPFAVMYEDREKTSIENFRLLPQLVYLDPSFLQQLPSLQRAVSGIDAFCQSVESLWNKKADTVSKTYAAASIRLLWKELPQFVKVNESDIGKRMLWASYLSGLAISSTRTTGCHALSYYLTAKHGIPHGQAVAFFLPLFFYYNKEANLDEICQLLQAPNEVEAAAKVITFMKSCGLATRFSEMGIKVNVDELLDSVNAERFSNNPVSFNREILKDLITQHLI